MLLHFSSWFLAKSASFIKKKMIHLYILQPITDHLQHIGRRTVTALISAPGGSATHPTFGAWVHGR